MPCSPAKRRCVPGTRSAMCSMRTCARWMRPALPSFRLNACGYSLGTTFAPIWMDGFMAYKDNPVIIQPGMVYFLHMIIFDDETGLAATPGRTSLVTAAGPEVLSQAGLDFVVK